MIANKARARSIILLQIFAALAVAALLAYFTVTNVTSTVAQLQTAVEKVRSGDAAAVETLLRYKASVHVTNIASRIALLVL